MRSPCTFLRLALGGLLLLAAAPCAARASCSHETPAKTTALPWGTPHSDELLARALDQSEPAAPAESPCLNCSHKPLPPAGPPPTDHLDDDVILAARLGRCAGPLEPASPEVPCLYACPCARLLKPPPRCA
jgi:hypothetical protein